MSAEEKSTFFGYDEGVDPDLLQIGSLVLDYANPRMFRPFLHPRVDDLFNDSHLATADSRPFCSMAMSGAKNYGFGLGLEPLVRFDIKRATKTSRLVVGQNGSKVELIDSDSFFEHDVLKNSDARFWLRTRLTVASRIQSFFRNLVAVPSIWLLTGVYYMEDAATYVLTTKESSSSISGNAPIIEPTGIAALVGAEIGANVSLGKDLVGMMSAKILGKKVWAGQWRKVDARYMAVEATYWKPESLLSQLKLLDTWSPGIKRGAGSIEVVDLKLADLQQTFDAEETDQGVSSEVWDKFDKEVEEVLLELSEEAMV